MGYICQDIELTCSLNVVRIWQNPDDVPTCLPGSVAIIGVFDGVHKGHQSIISRAVNKARSLELPSILVTFDPHPRQVLGFSHCPDLLTTISYRAVLAQDLGIDATYVVNFTTALAALEPEEFVRSILVDILHVKHVIVGKNFRFGAKAAGNCDVLTELGATYNFTVEAVDLLGESQLVYSASAVRSLITSGEVVQAQEILGHAYQLQGVVTRGHARGRELGFPTANIAVDANRAIPADGVYAGWFSLLSELKQVEVGEYPPAPITSTIPIVPQVKYPCAISIGTNPTFSQGNLTRTVEAYIIDASRDLYNMHVAIDFIDKVRGQKKFDSVVELVNTMGADVQATKRILGVSA